MSNQDRRWERLGEVVTQVMAANKVPGVAVGILHEGEIATAGFGVTHVEHPLPVTGDTLFQIGSITKTYVGTAIMRLVEKGDLDLDAPVRTYVPDFRLADASASEGATLRHVLTHTGGWAGDFFHDTGAGDDALARYVADMADLPQLAPLGTVWSYNNAGFSLAGYVVAQVTGKPFELALNELVLEPLGLARTFLDPGEVMTHRFVVGHQVEGGEAKVARPWPLVRSGYPQGGLVCDLQDLLYYARFHLGDGRAEDGTRLLSAESLAEMHAPQVTVWDKEAWGLSWASEEVEGTRQIRHGGGTKGQVTLLALAPEHDFALAVLTNADRGGAVTHDVHRWVWKEYLGLTLPKAEPIETSEGELAQYAGRYTGYFSDLEQAILGGKLVAQISYKRSFPSEDAPPPPAPPPMTVALCEKDRLLVLDGPYKHDTMDAIRGEDGAIRWLRVSGRLHFREG